MPMLLRSDAPIFNLPGICFTTLSSPRRGARENAVWEVTVDPGVVGSPHRLTREETFVALEGSAVVEVDGQRHELAGGQCARRRGRPDAGLVERRGRSHFARWPCSPSAGRR